MNTKSLLGVAIGLAVVILAAIFVVPLFQGSSTVKVSGAGSSFINPLMTTWASEYHDSVDTKVQINYASIGSGGGIQQLTEGTVDFGASDAPLQTSEATALGNNALHIPMTVGGITLSYNIAGVSDGLKLTGDLVAAIFMGNITKWNDANITAINSGVTLPNADIVVQHRSDGSGTTFGFTDYLSHVSTAWKNDIGTGKSIDWPVGVGGKGNEGVSANIKSTANSIGYVELAYAVENSFTTVALQNQNGDYVQASVQTIQNAMNGAANVLPKGEGDWSTVTMVNAPGKDSYPICSFTYVLVHSDLSNLASKDVAQKLLEFLWWAVHDGQGDSAALYYVPLASSVVTINERTLGLLNFKGAELTLPTS